MCRITVKPLLSKLVAVDQACFKYYSSSSSKAYSVHDEVIRCIKYYNVRMFTMGTKHQKDSFYPSGRNNKFQKEQPPQSTSGPDTNFIQSIYDLNSLQNNSQVIASGKQRDTKHLLPLFRKQFQLSGLEISDLDRLNIIHISGTKGKGSTCSFIESILRFAGLKTGCYTSPHLMSVTERIAISGSPIDETTFSRYFRITFDRLKYGTEKENIPMPGYFAFLTILAFHIFIAEEVDCVVLEVGIGGEYDPTNIVQKPRACGITTIDYDHTNLLGSTIESIAWSKAGIAKKGIPIFTIEHEQKEALEVIRSRAEEKGCPLYVCKAIKNSTDLKLGIKGKVQYTNAALACQLAKYFLATNPEHKSSFLDDLSQINVLESVPAELPDFFLEAIESCSWAGRCQILKLPKKTMYLDGAHTRKSMENCLDWFKSAYIDKESNNSQILMVNVIGERSRRDVLLPLARYNRFDEVIFSTNRTDSTIEKKDSHTYMAASDDKMMKNVYNNIQVWKDLCKELGNDDSNIIIKPNTRCSMDYIDGLTEIFPDKEYHVLVTGSLHFVGSVLSILNDR